MSGLPSPQRGGESAGDYALAFGSISILSTLIPTIGDFIAVPAAIVAVVCGVVGIRCHEAGLASKVIRATIGVLLGAAALLFVVLMFIVTHQFT